MNVRFFYTLLSIAAIQLALVGCAPSEPGARTDDHSGHDHAAEHEGPHGGHVIELGREHAYHAELVEDEQASTITVYLLDGDLKEMAIDAAPLTMNLTVNGEAQSFELAATHAADGKSSSFAAAGPELFQAIHEHHAAGKLRVTIDGTPYSGEVEHHDHEHAGHAH